MRNILICLSLTLNVAAFAQSRWSETDANRWYAAQPWLVGSNYIPATAINELEMWQAKTFDPKRIDMELGWAQGLGMNTMRVFLHDLLWKQDSAGFQQRINAFLEIADKHKIRPVFVLFDSCWDPFPKLGKQRAPRPGVHNSGWVQSPGADALKDPSQYPRLEAYVKGVVGAFANDKRILAWDIWNEPDNVNTSSYGKLEPPNKVALVLALLPKAFAWARAAHPTQPLTSGVWKGDWSSPAKLGPMERAQLELSDVISFHNYDPPAEFEKRVLWLRQYHHPILCTEYMARGNGSTFQGTLPIAKKYRVAAYNWGLVAGKTQTYLPWDSWQRPYTDRKPAVWFHEIFRTDGQPYRQAEVDFIRAMTGAAARSEASPASLVPARWASNDPKTLDLIKPTPINCLLLERPQWSAPFVKAAAQRGVAVLGVVHPGPSAIEEARAAASLQMSGVVLQGDFPDSLRTALADSKINSIDLSSRSRMRFNSSGVTGTDQGVWPGIEIQKDGETKSAPSGAPWIDTNTGFLRFARALTPGPIWIANLPPPNTVIPLARYLQVIGDAAMSGARWVVALDDDFNRRLLKGDPKAIADWNKIGECLRFYEDHSGWRDWQPRSDLAIVEDAQSGALLSGGILDMVAVKHTPVRPVPSRDLSAKSLGGVKLAADVDPSSLTAEQRAALTAFAHAGGTLLSAPSGWKFVLPKNGQITLGDESVKKLDEIWKELNSLTGRQNLGARLFNVSTMISNLVESPSGKQLVLHLVNYSDYPADSITVNVAGRFTHARLLAPGEKPKDLAPYEMEEGTGVDIDRVSSVAALVLE